MAVRGMPLTQLRAASKLLPPSAGERGLPFCRVGGITLLPGPSATSLLGRKPSKLKRQLEACKNKGMQQIYARSHAYS